jgi:hypothetical protein
MEKIPLYVLLVFDGRYLFIPQEEVESVEIIADVQVTRSSTGVIGWFFEHGNESPVFCLAKDLSLLLEMPKSREYFVLLKTGQEPLGITCDEVENINFKRELLHPQELEPVMKMTISPLRQLLIYKENIGCVCSGAALVEHLNSQLEHLEQNSEL